jgi:putative iron-dependent peroxidase
LAFQRIYRSLYDSGDSSAWQRLFSGNEVPQDLSTFEEMRDGGRVFPSTPGELFLMIKSERMGVNIQAAKQLKRSLSEVADLIENIQGIAYLGDRDLIGFVDGKENPIDDERAEAVLVGDEQPALSAGSYLLVQRYIDRSDLWESQTTEIQEMIIGRTKADNVELDDDAKPASAHTAKSIVEVDGEEIDMFRQNRPFGNAMEHGTMFVGFARSPDVQTTSLRQMITEGEDGNYDRLLDFVEAKTGTNYFVPSLTFLEKTAG